MLADIYAVGATATVAAAVLLFCGTAVNKVVRRHGQIKLIRRSRALEICVPHRGTRGYVGLYV